MDYLAIISDMEPFGLTFFILIALICYWGRADKPGTVGSWNGYMYETKDSLRVKALIAQGCSRDLALDIVYRRADSKDFKPTDTTFPKEWAETRNPE
jgi:hypothetical protein